MVIDSEVTQEEKKLRIRLGKAEIKQETATEDLKGEAYAERASAENQFGSFYESIENFQSAKIFYRRAIKNYIEAMQHAQKHGAQTSHHIYSELKKESEKSLERVGEKDKGLARKVSGTISAVSFIAGSSLITPTLTGYTIANLSIKTVSLTSISLIFISLIAGFFWFKNKD
jgi:hypothetical protein